MEHHISSSKLNLLLLTKTQVSGDIESTLYSLPSFFFYSYLTAKLNVAAMYATTLLALMLIYLILLNSHLTG